MTKKELVEKVSKKVGLTKRTSENSVNAVFGIIRDAMMKGEKVVDASHNLFEKWKKTHKTLDSLRKQKGEMKTTDLEKKFVNGSLVEKIDGADLAQLQSISKSISSDDRVLVLFGINDRIYVFVSAGQHTRFNASEIVRKICSELNGNGGGSRSMAQGVCNDKEKLDGVIEKIKGELI